MRKVSFSFMRRGGVDGAKEYFPTARSLRDKLKEVGVFVILYHGRDPEIARAEYWAGEGAAIQEERRRRSAEAFEALRKLDDA